MVFWLLGVASLMRLGDYLLVRDLLIHIYYSDGSWGRPHAHSAAYARVRHLFPHTTALSCTLKELGLIFLHKVVLLHFIHFHCFFRMCPFLLSFVFTFFIASSLFCLYFIYSLHYRLLSVFYLCEHRIVSVPESGETVWIFGLEIFFLQIPHMWSVQILNQTKNT